MITVGLTATASGKLLKPIWITKKKTSKIKKK